MSRCLVGCAILRPEAERILRREAPEVEARWLDVALHCDPARLRDAIRTEVAAAALRGHDTILLLYGLCAGSLEGVCAPAGVSLVLPRAHDCITLHLGSRERYATAHACEPGTYWCTRGFLALDGSAAPAGSTGETGETGGLPLLDDESRAAFRAELAESYGEEEADYLMENWAEGWTRHYRRAVLLAEEHPELARDRARVRRAAARYGWRYEEARPDWDLLRRLLVGEWAPEAFLVVPPGGCIRATHDAQVVRSTSAEEDASARG